MKGGRGILTEKQEGMKRGGREGKVFGQDSCGGQ